MEAICRAKFRIRATAAVCSVRLHSSVLLRTSVKCFFVFVQDATIVGEPLLLSTSPCHQPTSVATPSQGATTAVCSVRLHSSVLLRTSVKCFFCLCPGCHHCRGATAAFHFSLPPADQCHPRYQPFSRSHCCSVFGKTPFLGTFENKCEVFFLSLSRMPPL